MDSAILLMLSLMILLPAINEILSAKVQIISQSEYVNVSRGKDFNLRCEFTTHVNCSWQRNKDSVKFGNGRYSSDVKWFENGTTVCFCNVSGADVIDSGNWTCVIPNSEFYDGISSKIISVDVFMHETHIPSTGPSRLEVENQTQSVINITYNVQNEMVYIVIGVFAFLIISSILGILTWFWIKHKRKIKGKSSPSPSVHDYEEIDENAITFERLGQLEQTCNFIQPFDSTPNDGYNVPFVRNNPEEMIKLNIFNQRSSMISNQNIVTASHAYQNIGPNF